MCPNPMLKICFYSTSLSTLITDLYNNAKAVAEVD